MLSVWKAIRVITDADTFRRSSMGQVAYVEPISTLTQAQRVLLTLLDGSRTVSDLRRTASFLGNIDALLAHLLDRKMIEPTNTTVTTAMPFESPTPSIDDLTAIRRKATAIVTEQLGPFGEDVALRIERAREVDSLRSALQHAARVLTEVRGKAAAELLPTLVASTQ